jgi:predicted O-methyltransferase YrrM
LSGKAVVFEWGSGASTAWLAKRSAKVYSLEHDIEWAKTTKNLITKYKNVKLITIPPDNTVDMFEAEYISNKPGHRGLSFKNYVNSINDIDAQFDLIAIDGRCKSACLKVAISKLKPGGIVLFDDSKRRRYQKALLDSGLMIKRYKGMKSGVPFFPYETVVLISNKLATV